MGLIVLLVGVSLLFSLVGVGLYYAFETINGTSNKTIHNDISLSWSQDDEFRKLKVPIKCECGIVSRRYQMTGGNHDNCPHCDKYLNERDKKIHWMHLEPIEHYEVADNREFPFAPKLTKQKFLELWNQKEEMKRIEKEKNDLIETDKEIEAWQNIQQKKLEEYQLKAEEIKKELSNDNKIFGKMKWSNDEL